MVEGYIAEECQTFCSRYFSDVKTIFIWPQKNDDDLHNGDHYLFTSGGRIISKENITRLDCRSVQQAHRYVLLHSDEMNAFRE